MKDVPYDVELLDLYVSGDGFYQAHVTVMMGGVRRRGGGSAPGAVAAVFAALRAATGTNAMLYSHSVGSGKGSPDGSVENSLAEATVGLNESGVQVLMCGGHVDSLRASALAFCKALNALGAKKREQLLAAE